MKIMHFVHGLSTGGAETLVKNYVLNFDKKNEVVLVCRDHENGSPHEKRVLDSGIRTIFVSDLCRFKKGFLGKVCRYLALRKIIKREEPDVLHLHLSVCRMVKFARPGKRTALFYTVHSDPLMLWELDKKSSRKEFMATRWLVRNNGIRMIALHEEMKKEVDKMFGISNTLVLNNGVDVEVIKNAGNRDEMRKKLDISGEAFVVGHIGRFSRAKNHEFLVDVFENVKKKNKNAFLLLVGNGPDKEKVVDKLAKYRDGKDYLILENREDIPEILRAMDVFAFPSLWEGMPLSLVEAQVAEIPCFVSDRINRQAEMSNLVTQLPLESGAEKWAESILAYKKPKKIVVDDADWDIKKITKKLERIYAEAAREKQNGEE